MNLPSVSSLSIITLHFLHQITESALVGAEGVRDVLILGYILVQFEIYALSV